MMPGTPDRITDWARAGGAAPLWQQATAVAVDGQGILITGRSGSGKSGLALAIMALGGVLVSDDGVWLALHDGTAMLLRPDSAPPLIEARGIGLLRAGPILAAAPLAIAVDLDTAEDQRLPPRRVISLGHSAIPLIKGAGAPSLAAALVLMARQGCAEP